MDLEAVLGLLDDEAKNRAFEHSLSNLETSPRMEFEALKVCIRLRPRLDSTHQGVDKLLHLLIQRIPCEPLDSDHVYRLAEILCTDGSFADVLFRERIYTTLVALLPEFSTRTHAEADVEQVRKGTAYLTLLKCSYWLPSAKNHVLGPGLLELLSSFLGLPELESVALNAISALLSLLKREELVVVASSKDSPQPWLKPTSIPGQMVLAEPVVDGSFWNSLSNLDSTSFKTGRPIIFSSRRTHAKHKNVLNFLCSTLWHNQPT
jgi:tRNA guanosine-2'-O-methyltransferase